MTGVELMKNIILYDIFVIYNYALLILGTLWIYKNFVGKTAIKRMILLGCICTIIGEVYSYATVYFEFLYDSPYIVYLNWLLPYSITYLVLKHRLFDARSILLQMLRWIFIGGVGFGVGF
jgi:hypothetical protein